MRRAVPGIVMSTMGQPARADLGVSVEGWTHRADAPVRRGPGRAGSPQPTRRGRHGGLSASPRTRNSAIRARVSARPGAARPARQGQDRVHVRAGVQGPAGGLVTRTPDPATGNAPAPSRRAAQAKPGGAGPGFPPAGPAGQSSPLLPSGARQVPPGAHQAAAGSPAPATRAGLSNRVPARDRGRTQTPGGGGLPPQAGGADAPSPGLQGAEWRKAVKAAQAGNRRRTTTRTARQPAPAPSLPVPPPGAGAALTATAHCIGACEWTAGPGPAGDIDAAAEKHTKKPPKHPTAIVAECAA